MIEFPGGDAVHARIYLGPQLYGSGSDLVPVTLSFVDVSGHHQPDMLVHLHYKGSAGTRVCSVFVQTPFGEHRAVRRVQSVFTLPVSSFMARKRP